MRYFTEKEQKYIDKISKKPEFIKKILLRHEYAIVNKGLKRAYEKYLDESRNDSEKCFETMLKYYRKMSVLMSVSL